MAENTEKTTETKREHFVRLAEARVNAIIVACAKLEKLGNPHLYEYADGDVTAIEEATTKALSEALGALKAKGSRKAVGFKL